MGLACDVQSLCAALAWSSTRGAVVVRAVAAAQAATVLPRSVASVFSPLPPSKALTLPVHCKCPSILVAEDCFKWCYELNKSRVGASPSSRSCPLGLTPAPRSLLCLGHDECSLSLVRLLPSTIRDVRGPETFQQACVYTLHRSRLPAVVH